MVHCSELSDRLAGVIGGYLVWSGMVDSSPGGISVMERITGRQLGPQGRGLVALAERLPDRGSRVRVRVSRSRRIGSSSAACE